MATIWKYRKGESIAPDPCGWILQTRDLLGAKVETCAVCGLPNASAYWRGHQNISVCQTCSVEALPMLIADAVVGENGDSKMVVVKLLEALEGIKKSFWRAATVAVHRGCQVARREAALRERARPGHKRNGIKSTA